VQQVTEGSDALHSMFRRSAEFVGMAIPSVLSYSTAGNLSRFFNVISRLYR